ncbi:PucR family transcriptional regulator ligand-binding domain-containing protein [Caballeronia sp. ATUFL_M1_KS5A]|uniref:PucR family transcriptional regulator n=1 Tax=Caballeronia sp. ATUFL_M1_KS5A TaxID=2921778 RepID=UPI00202925D2|nr:PucR family transcriptional regulator ligand-binding domain-containing protein [Caballeronia sp. ATUFL_M1_KS5A]
MIKVQELLDTKSLRLAVLGGSSGLARTINWAHAVDLPDPWRWIAAGNLVMTTGVGLPCNASEQVTWLEKLAQSNASALVVARRADAPELSREMLEAADRLMFPVLAASFELEFVQLSRHVIESVLQAQRDRFRASEQLFETYATALREVPDMAGRLTVLSDRLRLGLAIEDAGSGAIIVSSSDSLPTSDATHPVFVERVAIGGRARVNLVIRRRDSEAWQDPLLVRSLLGLLEIELERMMIDRDNLRKEGEALLRSLLRGEAEFSFRPILARRGLTGTLVVLAVSPGKNGPWSVAEIHHAPAMQSRPPLLLEDDVLLALAQDHADTIECMRLDLGKGTFVGISGPVTEAAGFRESVRQARLAMAQAREVGTGVVRYGEVETGYITMPRSLAEASALVGHYLSPLIEYDRVHGSELLTTLTTFLANDGNWKATAFALDIHRQTLVYRLKQIEQLCRVKPTSTDGITRLWLAVQAGKAANLLPANPDKLDD